jgi:tRNA A-37 threonylcarbamoyl transferase component Bud32
LIGHGAEAKVFLIKDSSTAYVVKVRLPKKYRHPILDARINSSRVKS